MKPHALTSIKPLHVRLMWMATLWVAGVACVGLVSLLLRGVLHR